MHSQYASRRRTDRRLPRGWGPRHRRQWPKSRRSWFRLRKGRPWSTRLPRRRRRARAPGRSHWRASRQKARTRDATRRRWAAVRAPCRRRSWPSPRQWQRRRTWAAYARSRQSWQSPSRRRPCRRRSRRKSSNRAWRPLWSGRAARPRGRLPASAISRRKWIRHFVVRFRRSANSAAIPHFETICIEPFSWVAPLIACTDLVVVYRPAAARSASILPSSLCSSIGFVS